MSTLFLLKFTFFITFFIFLFGMILAYLLLFSQGHIACEFFHKLKSGEFSPTRFGPLSSYTTYTGIEQLCQIRNV